MEWRRLGELEVVEREANRVKEEREREREREREMF